jgi:signal transduction histidine kinase
MGTYNIANLISSGLQSAVALSFAIALTGMAVTFGRPAMRSLALVWVQMALGTMLGLVADLVPGRADVSGAVAAIAYGLLGSSLPAMFYASDSLAGRTDRKLPPVRDSLLWGFALAAIVAVGMALRSTAFGGSSILFIGFPRWLAIAMFAAAALHARRLRRGAGTERPALFLLAAGFGSMSLRSAINVVVSYAAANQGLTAAEAQLNVGLNIVILIAFGVMTMLAALAQERTAIVAQGERLRAAEARLATKDRMASLGLLASSVAHDFNNVLTTIAFGAAVARVEHAHSERLRVELDEIERTVVRGRDLTAQLLTIARRQPQQPVRFDAGERLQALRRMLTRLVGSEIRLTVDVAGGGATIEMDPSQFEQIVMNLVANARDAMPGGGAVHVETALETLTVPRTLHEETLPAGVYVRLSVEDTGAGIAPEVMPRILEPFFTTKPADRGTGLGLSIVYGIVRQAHGDIAIRSEIGAGARFDILLPAVA